MKTDQTLSPLAEHLAQDGGLKLWSVLVTILGDFAAHDQCWVPGVFLADTIERIGLKPEAMRVALHRLKRDGWVETDKRGRRSFHRLSDHGLAQADAVHKRVYDVAPEQPMSLSLVLTGQTDVERSTTLLETQSAITLAPGVLLAETKRAAPSSDWLSSPLVSQKFPNWVLSRLETLACEREFIALKKLLVAMDTNTLEEPSDRYAARILVLHGWRRLVLRSSPLAESILGPRCAAARCRGTVRGLLDHLRAYEAT